MEEKRQALIAQKENKKKRFWSFFTFIVFLGVFALEAFFLSNLIEGKYEEVVAVFAPTEEINSSFVKEDILEQIPIIHTVQAVKVEPYTPPIVQTPKMIAFTFDDGPSDNTSRLLDILKKNNAKATFFLVGQNAGRYPDTIKKIVAQGCEVATHSWAHPNLNELDPEGIKNEILTSKNKIQELSNQPVKYLRPPYGNCNENVKEIAKKQGLSLILWNVDTLDWKTRDKNATVEHILTHAKDGDIILMHDLYSQTVDAVEEVLPKLKKKGYTIVTVSELLEKKGYAIIPGEKYYSAK